MRGEEGGRVESEGESEEITEPLSGGHYYSFKQQMTRGGGEGDNLPYCTI